MYEKYFERLKEECLIRNRSSRTAEAYISNIISFMKWTGNKPMEELCLQVNCTPFVRQYDILNNKWGALLCQKESQTKDIHQNSRKWL